MATRRLQELFAKFDTSGDGVLQEEEMKLLFEKLGLGKKDVSELFETADSNKDGVIQVHEFISWLTASAPKVAYTQTKTGVDATITNPHKCGKSFSLTFNNCTNVSFPEGNPATFLLEPGEQITKTVIAKVDAHGAWRWNSRWSSRSKYIAAEDDPNAFRDADFPCDESSIGTSGTCWSVGKPDTWVRARLLGDPETACLFDQIRPQDILQGQVGDCWLLSALSALAEHPQRIRYLFPNTRQLSEDGKYEVRLYDLEKEDWVEIVIDEFVPCNTGSGTPTPTFSKPLGEEVWVQLLEKAFAKYCGSYGALSGGNAGFAFQVLTGEVHIRSYEKLDEGKWRRRRMDPKMQIQRGPRNPLNSYWRWKNSDLHAPEALFEVLQSELSSKHTLVSIITENSKSVEEAQASGLYKLHFYSILSAVSEQLDDGTAVKLVQMRNPYGRKEWTKDWSDSSSRWEENPELRKRIDVRSRNDGQFWMSFEDWERMFSVVTICPSGGAPPEEDDEEEGAEDNEAAAVPHM
ncbi:CAPN1 [Symbiodinium natans]|uniref:CAPN1 protein n=1 Tax=Symbiodinium natans TaxID=878477 RepID=A0A812NQV2_9DINO|nr:CAPN1 [Symbiodinium natans]